MSSHREYSSVSSDDLTNKSNNTSPIPSTYLGRILLVLFPCMIFTGIICNTLIFIIMRRRRMSQISTCYYMRILAIADTNVLLLGLSDMWLYLLNPKWSLLSQSTYTCKIFSLILYTTSDTSEWIVCLMSIDRCIVVTRPLHANSVCTVRRAKISLCTLVLCMLLINMHFLFTHYLSSDYECEPYGRYEYFIHRIWTWIDATIYAFVPFIILLTVNLIIICSLFHARHSLSNLQEYQPPKQQDKQRLSASMSGKLTKMLLAVTVFSLFASFPAVCLEIYTNIHPNDFKLYIALYVKPLCLTLQFTNHYINFFLYAMAGRAFRDELKRLFRTIAVKMHLSQDTRQMPINEYLMRNNIQMFNDRWHN